MKFPDFSQAKFAKFPDMPTSIQYKSKTNTHALKPKSQQTM